MSDKLHVQVRGEGPALVLLHGWGLHGGVFATLAERLAEDYRLYIPDLPGHGRSPLGEAPFTLPVLATRVAASVPADAHWLGWSLGGLVALSAALAGAPMASLTLAASSPRFVQAEDWPDAIEPTVLAGFAVNLEQDYRGTLLRFLALQAQGSDQAREEIRRLRGMVFERGEPHPRALRKGLELLQDSDLRPQLNKLAPRTLLLYGQRDTLAPAAAAPRVAAAIPDARVAVVTGAGHAPFLSHTDDFIQSLSDFIHA